MKLPTKYISSVDLFPTSFRSLEIKEEFLTAEVQNISIDVRPFIVWEE